MAETPYIVTLNVENIEAVKRHIAELEAEVAKQAGPEHYCYHKQRAENLEKLLGEARAERDRLKDEIAVRSVLEEGLRRDLAEAEKQVKKLKSRMRPIV